IKNKKLKQMNCYENDIKDTCFQEQYASCVYYEKNLPDFTKIEEDCVTIEDTTEDIYNIISDIKEELDISGLGNKCITYPTDKNINTVLQQQEQEICELKQKVQDLESGN